MSSTDVSNFWGPYGPAMDYLFDAAQRSVLFWDVMRQRGNQYRDIWRKLLRMCWIIKLSSSSTVAD